MRERGDLPHLATYLPLICRRSSGRGLPSYAGAEERKISAGMRSAPVWQIGRLLNLPLWQNGPVVAAGSSSAAVAGPAFRGRHCRALTVVTIALYGVVIAGRKTLINPALVDISQELTSATCRRVI